MPDTTSHDRLARRGGAAGVRTPPCPRRRCTVRARGPRRRSPTRPPARSRVPLGEPRLGAAGTPAIASGRTTSGRNVIGGPPTPDRPSLDVFVAGIRRLDRTRGSGWLVCPNCGEHAVQDVVDEMRFLALFFYRFTPVGRRRVLVCNRCGYRRPATTEELARLQTGGRPIGRAWLLPIGLSPFVAVGVLLLVASATARTSAPESTSYTSHSASPIAPLTFDGPSTWQYNAEATADPPAFLAEDPGARTTVRIERITPAGSLVALLADHWADEVNINATGFPEVPCPTRTVTVAGQKALRSAADFQSEGEAVRQVVFVLEHEGVGYVVIFVAHGKDAINALPTIVDRMISSFRFTGPEPSASPSPSPEESPSASATPTPVPTPTLQPGCSK